MYIYIYIYNDSKYIYIHTHIYIYIYIYIYSIHEKYHFATQGFTKFIATFIRQLRRWNEIENRKCDKKQTKNR